ncbi:MAG TPA: DUF1501 domain-containing protein [Verrucomicrobiae bacterium]|nr:DUF1501 domain-containing protein [Verrucomicrobiae bacterium]
MQSHSFNVFTRRSFLDRSVKTSLAVALSTLTDIPLVMKQALAEGSIGLNGKKVLFLWLRGANDGLNSLVPMLDSAYAPNRPTLAIPPDPATNYALTGPADFPTAGDASTYGAYPFGIRLGNGFAALHPSLKFLAPVYNAGDLALIHRVAYPRQSRSHFDSQRYWENGSPNNNLSQDGIFYRTILESGLANSAPLTGVSIQSSLPLILRGSEAAMTNLTDPLRYDLLGIPNNAAGNAKATAFLTQANTIPFPPKQSRGLLQLQYENLTSTLSIFAGLDFTETGNTFRDPEITDSDTAWAAANGGEGYYLFPTTNVKNGGWRRPDGSNAANKYAVNPNHQSLFDHLKAAAIILNKTDAIIAGTELGGFDTHQRQGQLTGNHPDLNRAFGWAIYALRKYFTRYADKATWDNLVIVTLTEFGRTTVENSDQGTDHAEAGAMFVAGGNIRGYDNAAGRTGVFNCSPADSLPWVTGGTGTMFGANGRYVKRASDYRQVLGEIIRDHLGATQSQLNRIIPGYANPAEHLLSGGTSIDGTQIRGELGLI